MVILIGGESCTGKTLLAQRLLARYNIPYLSADLLKMGLCRGLPGCPFCPGDGDAAITEYLWPILRGMAMTAIENGQHLIIEGCYIPCDARESFPPACRDDIIAIFIGFSEDYILRNYDDILLHRNDIERRKYAETRTAGAMAAQHTRLRARCQKAGAPYFEVDADYGADMEDVHRRLDGEIEKRLKTN